MFKVGDKITITQEITDEMIRKFAEVSGDFNPMHLDDEYAAKTRFKRRIAHGMIGAALISRALAQELGPGGIYRSQTLKFMSPMFIGDVITVEVTVTQLRESRGIATAETICRNQNGEICCRGEAVIVAASGVKDGE